MAHAAPQADGKTFSPEPAPAEMAAIHGEQASSASALAGLYRPRSHFSGDCHWPGLPTSS